MLQCEKLCMSLQVQLVVTHPEISHRGAYPNILQRGISKLKNRNLRPKRVIHLLPIFCHHCHPSGFLLKAISTISTGIPATVIIFNYLTNMYITVTRRISLFTLYTNCCSSPVQLGLKSCQLFLQLTRLFPLLTCHTLVAFQISG